jgi:hypothetical protein
MRSLKSQLERMSLDNRQQQKASAQQLADAAQALRDRKTEEKIRASQAQIQYSSPEYAKAMEESIGGDIADLGQRLENASKAASEGQQEGQRQAQALDRTRELVNGMESLAERMRQRQEASSGKRLAQGQEQGQQGQQGQQNGAQNGDRQGKQGQQGQRGQQGQEGQQGKQGQGQGQGQSSQSQGQQGQGQGGGNGQQNGQQGGQNGQGGQPQSGRMAGGMNGGTPTANGGRLSEGDARQFGRELRERLNDAQQLRNDLQRQGLDVAELDRAIKGMRSLADENLLMDPTAAATLKAQILDGLKGFEFDLRRSLGLNDKDRVLLGRSGDVPEAYRQYVEDYYKALAAGKKKPK